MRRSFVYAALVALSLGVPLAACNTMAGAGQDMQEGGHALTNSADQHGATPQNEVAPQNTAPQQ